MKFWRFLKYYYFRFRRLQGSPQALAGGTAIGVFIGLTPTIPFHTVLIVFLTLVSRTSTLAAIVVSWIICNPLTFLPIYYLSAKTGNYLTPYQLDFANVQIVLEQAMSGEGIQQFLTVLMGSGYEALVVLLIGGICFALPFTLVSYYSALIFFVQIQKKRIKKRVLS